MAEWARLQLTADAHRPLKIQSVPIFLVMTKGCPCDGIVWVQLATTEARASRLAQQVLGPPHTHTHTSLRSNCSTLHADVLQVFQASSTPAHHVLYPKAEGALSSCYAWTVWLYSVGHAGGGAPREAAGTGQGGEGAATALRQARGRLQEVRGLSPSTYSIEKCGSHQRRSVHREEPNCPHIPFVGSLCVHRHDKTVSQYEQRIASLEAQRQQDTQKLAQLQV